MGQKKKRYKVVTTFEDAANEAAQNRRTDNETYQALLRASAALDTVAMRVGGKTALEGEANHHRSLAYSQAASLLERMAENYREGSLDWDAV